MKKVEGFSQINNCFTQNENINYKVKQVVSILFSFYNRKEKRCFVSEEKIAKIMGVSRSSIIRYIKQAVELNLIKIERKNHYRSNYYYFSEEIYPTTKKEESKPKPVYKKKKIIEEDNEYSPSSDISSRIQEEWMHKNKGVFDPFGKGQN